MVYDSIRHLSSSGRSFQSGQADWVCPGWSLWARTLPLHLHTAPQAACSPCCSAQGQGCTPGQPLAPISCSVSKGLKKPRHCSGVHVVWERACTSISVPVHSNWTGLTSSSANGLLCGCTSISRSDSGTVFWFPLVLLPARPCDSQGKLPWVCLSQESEPLHCGKDWFHFQFLAAPIHLRPLQFKATDTLASP